MKINDIKLEVQAVRRSQYPEGNKPEFMMIGRSNVGKSSFVNAITGRKNIAHTSGKPGKTQTLNFYSVDNSFYLVDVPGYGYASVNRKTQEKFGKMIEEYLEKRDSLIRVFMLVDFRHKPTEDDVLMYNFLKYYNIPVTIVATKVDKVGGSKTDKNKKIILDTLNLVVGDDLVLFSSLTKLGKEEILAKLDQLVNDKEAVVPQPVPVPQPSVQEQPKPQPAPVPQPIVREQPKPAPQPEPVVRQEVKVEPAPKVEERVLTDEELIDREIETI